ncbi:MAG: cupin domain-containing protein [Clostridia bacterium]|nr:cupin domain-containing protein [Clostridia bacterium]
MNKVLVKTMSREEADMLLGVNGWGRWSCGAETFDWSYPQSETCYILEGEVTIKYDGNSVSFKAGDLVYFCKGLDCTWCVTKPVRKFYSFGRPVPDCMK